MSNINNNAHKKHSNERKISSRVTPKIREYLAEIANEREVDLERFMILSSSSPASSGVSVGAHSFQNEAAAPTTTTTTTATGAVTMRSCRSNSSSSRCRSRARATTTIGAAAATAAAAEKLEETKITNIPIVLLTSKSSAKDVQLLQKSSSVEELRTPTKCTQTETPQMQTRKTQTPESALKSHKRLEWDPAADVGYRCERAVSTSNISTLERSVLEEAITLQRSDGRSNQSETDLNRLKNTTGTGTAPPLASSTFVNRSVGSQAQIQAQAQVTPVPRSTPVASTNVSSRRESCMTSAASSFDYQPQSRSCSSTASSRHTLSANELLHHMEQQRQEREYKAQLEHVLSRRRQMANKENQEPTKQQASSLSSNASSVGAANNTSKNDLDLGIDLLCSLVNKRSLSSSQKKRLAKDIVKRLVGYEMVSSRSSSCSTRHHKEQAQQTEQTPGHVKDSGTNTSRRSSVILPSSSAAQQTEQTPGQVKDSGINTSRRSSVILPSSSAATPVHLTVPVPAPRTRRATPTESPAPISCSYSSTTSGASNELVTQKTNLQAAKPQSDAAVEQAVLQEWLNPMTQSEIEYEQKQQRQQQPEQSNLSLERRTQIDWIDAEIRRLSALQNLLRCNARGDGASAETLSQWQPVEQQKSEGKAAATSAGEVRTAPPAPPVTPVCLVTATGTVEEEGAQDAVASSAASSSGAAAPTVTSSSAASLEAEAGAAAGAAAAAVVVVQVAAGRTNESVAPQPPPLPPAVAVRQPLQQRSKMATPTLSHSGSSESVCSFVQHRQRQFLAHYQNQQQQRLEQQQQLIMLQQQQKLIQRQQRQQRQQQAACHMQHCHHHEHQSHYVQMQYSQAVGNGYSCIEDGAVYYQVLNSQRATAAAGTVVTAAATATATAVATTTTVAGVTSNSCTGSNTSSSLMCLSSEMSIPMGGSGSLNACEATTTTTATTTTHQYDDVACQQLQFQLQLRQSQRQRHRQRNQQPMQLQQQMLQVRPRGIAYLLQFTHDDDVGQVLHESLTVQDYLQRARPQFCAQSKQRKAILNQMQLLRNARRRELDELIEGNSVETIDRRLQQLPPPVTSKVRIFSTREMKALTNKRCENLPEVLAAQNRQKEERRRRSNRIMRDVFNRRLQRRVRSGKLSLNHSRTVI